MKVQVVNGSTTTTLATYSNLGHERDVRPEVASTCRPYKGKTVTVKFIDAEDSSLQTSFVVDDTSVATS